jgi:hypothetical protein
MSLIFITYLFFFLSYGLHESISFSLSIHVSTHYTTFILSIPSLDSYYLDISSHLSDLHSHLPPSSDMVRELSEA